MARTTRSTTAATTTQPPQQHVVSKKRKRVKTEDDDGHPPPKRHESQTTDSVVVYEPAMLEILEMTDTLGLLDRVFPVLRHDGHTSSLRALLEHPHPVPVLRAAIQHLFPISSLPRAKHTPTTTQQLRFCNLAVSLLHQAASLSPPVPLSLSDILPTDSHSAVPTPRALRYALVQHLPSGDYWTSLNSDADLSTAFTQLPTAQAELVAILPTPPTLDTTPPPTLGSYSSEKSTISIKPLPTHRSVTTGAFLDYGVWASFAPSFDHNAEAVGPRELAQAIHASHEKRMDGLAALREAREGRGSIEEIYPEDPHVDYEPDSREDLDDALQELFPPDDAAAIKAALNTLELENAVQELLDRNRRALVRLEELQITRLSSEGENSTATEGSEEWDTAQGIIETLIILASLRPRTSTSTNSAPTSILPPAAVLHKLHRTLALHSTQGWYGTLPSTSFTALHDDNTLKKSRSMPATAPATTSAAAAAATTTTTPAPAQATAPVTVATPVTMPYSGYTFSYGVAAQQQQQQQQYRSQNGTTQYSSYTPQFYPYAAQAMHQTQQGVVPMQPNYYGQQQQGYAAAAYSGWYNPYAGQSQTLTATGGSGRGTPQPQTAQQPIQVQTGQSQTVPAAAAGAYGSFIGGATRTPAVANTVQTPQAAGGGTPVLPVHLRSGLQQQQGSFYGTAAGR